MTGGVSRGAAAGLHGPMGGERRGEKKRSNLRSLKAVGGVGNRLATVLHTQRGWRKKNKESCAQ